MATIKDVAEDAKVSIATISKVINNKGKISEETRQRVLESIKKVHYISPPKSSKARQSLSVGLIIPSITNSFFPTLAKNVEQVLSGAGYVMFLCTSDRNEQVELDYLKNLVKRQVDGIIIYCPSKLTMDWINSHPTNDTVFIFIEEPLDSISYDFFKIDNYNGMKEAVQYIISLKHRRIAYITGPLKRACNQERLEAFRDTQISLDVPVIEEFILESNFEYEGGYNLTWQLLKHPDPPTAIFTGNDLMAFGAINCIIEQGLKVPEDISVIGFDDIPQASYFIPSLTTVRQPFADLGKMAAKHIIDILSQREPLKVPFIPTSLVIRRSTGFCKEG